MVLIRGFNLVTEEMAGKNNSIFQIPHDGCFLFEQFYRKNRRTARPAIASLAAYTRCRVTKANEWQHFEMGFNLPKINASAHNASG